MTLIPYISPGAREFIISNFWLVFLMAICGIVLSCVLVCVQSLARQVPTNYYLMFAFTFCEAYTVMFVCAVVNDMQTVLAAAFMTAGLVLGLTYYALTTKHDFTTCGGMLYAIGASFIMFSLLSIFFGPTMRLIYCLIGVVLFSIYLVFDTQYIVGGKHKRYQLSKDDYIIGAIILYLDIINLFLYILEILSYLRGE